MTDTLRCESLDNGLTVTFHDRSHRYYGNFHRVRIEVCCPVPVTARLFSGLADAEERFERARTMLGKEAVYRQTLERMGVSGETLAETKQAMVDGFIRHTFAYLEKPDFARRFVEREMARRSKVIRPVQLHR